MSAPLALTLFQALCDIANALEQLREQHTPASDEWCAHTEILLGLDAAIDTLVHSNGMHDDDAI